MTLDAGPFRLDDPDRRRLYEVLMDAYEGVEGIERLGLLARGIGLSTQSINLQRALDLTMVDLLDAAVRQGKLADLVRTAAVRNPAMSEELLRLLDAISAPPARGPAGAGQVTAQRPLDRALADLEAASRPRSPVVIAVESTDEPLDEGDLLRTERHLTVTLGPEHLESIRRCTTELADLQAQGTFTVDDVVDAGTGVWNEMVSAEPRLKGLLERIRSAGLAQPLAWCGRGDLLSRLQVALLAAHSGDGVADGFLTVGGGHYFMPTDVGRHRTILPRSPDTALRVRVVEPDSTAAEALPQDVAGSDIVVLLGGSGVAGSIKEFAGRLLDDRQHATRALVGFGAGVPDAELVTTVLETLPFLSSAPGALSRPEVVRALRRALTRHATDRSLPCIVAAVRAACIRESADAGDSQALLDALSWSTWSWVGLPLFAEGFDELLPAAYPHLMDLRTVSAEGWYFPRRRGIPDDYSAEMLSGEVHSDRLFHLYLSGAGGTGKSCFLRYVADRLASRPRTIPIWYRVDTPSSSWENIEDRLREETIAAIRSSSYGAEPAGELTRLPGRPTLGVFLNEAVTKLRSIDPGFEEIVVFIDQLERTFESGDEPDPTKLEIISGRVGQLMKTVGIGNGVRLFIASRKQYLPDFLRSSRTAQAANLEFNVLQSIDDSSERLVFVQTVIDWCMREQLVATNLVMPADAKAKVAESAQGHPLNMMLSLIQVLSARPRGEVSAADLETLRPWENLFALDLKAAERDDVVWHFLLAMAHARTEIVRIEEVWWRLRMVDRQLTRQVEDLTVEGVLERLWLFGFIGRTLHVRPFAGYHARFVEFFHANLRDHLLRNVMVLGGSEADVRRRRTGTPPAWRALDRLASYARDWEQTQQLLPPEDVHILMEHRKEVIEQVTPPGDEPTQRFQLFFLRESDDNTRDRLCTAAAQCFSFSSLVHDERGRDTFTTLFPDVDNRVDLCQTWLERGSAETRPALLAYLVETETPKARSLVTRLVLDEPGSAGAATSQEIAALLTEPLYAGEFRNQIVALLLRESLARARFDIAKAPARLVAFVVAACGGERDAVVRVLEYGIDRLKSDADSAVRDLGAAMEGSDIVELWMDAAQSSSSYRAVRTVGRAALPVGAVLGVVVGEHLRSVVDEARLAAWSSELRSRLAVPLPALRALTGECEDDELELRSPRGRLAVNLFRADQVRVDGRQWETFVRGTPNTAYDSYDLTAGRKVLWLPPEVVKQAGYPFAARTFDEAAVEWLEDQCRRDFDLLLDGELWARIVRDWAVAAASRGRKGTAPEWLGLLRRVIVDLVQEGVPLGPPFGPTDGPPAPLVVDQLARLSDVQPPESLTQAIRELLLRPWICRAVADESSQVTTLLLDERLERSLDVSLLVVRGRRVLALQPREAARLHAAVRRAVERVLSESGRPPLVIITDRGLRQPLANLLWQYGTRYPVLSYFELDLNQLNPVPGGLVSPSDGQGTV